MSYYAHNRARLLRPSGPLNLQDFTSVLEDSSFSSTEEPALNPRNQDDDTSSVLESLSLQDSPPLRFSPICGALSSDPGGRSQMVGVRVQFLFTRKPPQHTHGRDPERMMVVGSLPQLTTWGAGCKMFKANGTWQYDFILQSESAASTVVEFLYKYVAVDGATREIVWESRISRCKLQLDKLLDHVFPTTNGTAAGPGSKIKIVFQANGIPSSAPQSELVLTGSTRQLGNWDMTKAKVLRQACAGTFTTTLHVDRDSNFLYSFFLIDNASTLFAANTSAGPPLGNGGMLWTSGVGRMRPADPGVDAVVQLLDEWEQNPNPQVPPPGRKVVAPVQGGSKRGPGEVERLACKVCWEAEIAMAIVPCGHTPTCWHCGTLVTRCPICRAHIAQRIRIYI